EAALAAAVAASSFDAMRAIETSGGAGSPRLKPGDPSDPESFKIRRGAGGGYGDYLSSEDIAYVDGLMARDLPAGFGGRPGRPGRQTGHRLPATGNRQCRNGAPVLSLTISGRRWPVACCLFVQPDLSRSVNLVRPSASRRSSPFMARASRRQSARPRPTPGEV